MRGASISRRADEGVRLSNYHGYESLEDTRQIQRRDDVEQANPFGRRSTADDVLAGVDLSGRRALVTGANVGIGFETARALAARGAEVILACRNPERGEAAAVAIREGHPASRIEFGLLDLADFASIRNFTDGLASMPIDWLICNAGVLSRSYGETRDGIEKTVGICHFGHYLLANRLLPNLRAASEARLVMVSSESHRQPRALDFDHFPQTRESFGTLSSYGQAKLCNILFAAEFQRRHGIISCSLHPGALIPTQIARESTVMSAVMRLVRPFVKTLEQAAGTVVYCATAPEVADARARYYADCSRKRESSEARSCEVAERLWTLSEDRSGGS